MANCFQNGRRSETAELPEQVEKFFGLADTSHFNHPHLPQARCTLGHQRSRVQTSSSSPPAAGAPLAASSPKVGDYKSVFMRDLAAAREARIESIPPTLVS